MNGAESLVRTLINNGIDVCFTNPGTSEMHFVAALDRVPGMRCVLGLFEGVVTGAADGYARMAEKPAATLLHLGPGLGNGLANLHNARRANTPIVNIVGEHATYHRAFDAPLTADIEGIARPVSAWLRTSPDARAVAGDGAAAIAAARAAPGHIATLILPADTAWNDADGPAEAPAPAAATKVSAAAVAAAAKALRSGQPALLLLSGTALRREALTAASRVAGKIGARIMSQTSNARVERGAGRVAAPRVPYPVEHALAVFKDVRTLILVGAKEPVAFFAYPGKPSRFAREDCEILTLATPAEDTRHALEWLADELGANGAAPSPETRVRLAPPAGKLTVEAIGAAIGALLPENAIICDESVTSGRGFHEQTKGAAPHDYLQLTGGSIGLGLPLATGAAVACPDRKVLSLEGDGSGMYTLQALWTQARERLDVVTVIFANRSYAILRHELTQVGAKNPGRTALDMLSLDNPALDWVAMARGMGVAGGRATTADEFVKLLSHGFSARGPFLIEAAI